MAYVWMNVLGQCILLKEPKNTSSCYFLFRTVLNISLAVTVAAQLTTCWEIPTAPRWWRPSPARSSRPWTARLGSRRRSRGRTRRRWLASTRPSLASKLAPMDPPSRFERYICYDVVQWPHTFIKYILDLSSPSKIHSVIFNAKVKHYFFASGDSHRHFKLWWGLEKRRLRKIWNGINIVLMWCGDGLTASLFNLSQTVLERWETHLNRNSIYTFSLSKTKLQIEFGLAAKGTL